LLTPPTLQYEILSMAVGRYDACKWRSDDKS
jgi:hypothetical protein